MAHPNPEITVAICLYNSSAFIDATLASVLDQTFADFEVLLVDDGSTDGCLDSVQQRFNDARIRVVRQPHAGLGAARVTSVSAAQGRYIAFLDHDDLWEREKLAVQVAMARDRPDAGLVFCPCTYIDAEGCAIDGPASRLDLRALDLSAGGALTSLLRHGCFIELSSVLMPKAVVDRVGGFNPSLVYVEDFDLWLRVARTMAMAYVPAPLVRRRLHTRQFTQQRPDVAVAEQRTLLTPVVSSGTYPAEIRRATADYISGQHCACASRLFGLGRYGNGLKAAAGALVYPGGLRLAAAYWGSRTPAGRLLRDMIRRYRGGRRTDTENSDHAQPPAEVTEVWFDATPLDSAQTGYFGFTLDLLRVLLSRSPAGVAIHADVPEPVISQLPHWLGPDAARLLVHPVAAAITLWRSHRRQTEAAAF